MSNIITHNVPELLKEKWLKTVWPRRLKRLHIFKCIPDLIFGHIIKKSIRRFNRQQRQLNGGNRPSKTHVINNEKFLEKTKSFPLQSLRVIAPDITNYMKALHLVSFSPNHGLSMKEGIILVTKFNPLLFRFLILENLFLLQCLLIFKLHHFFKSQNAVEGAMTDFNLFL